MEYMTCPTCGYCIGNKSIEFNKKKEEICCDKSLSEEEQEKKIQKVLMKLGLRRYCCRFRLMTCVDLSKIIV